MRPLLLLVLAGACASGKAPPAEYGAKVRVLSRQFYGGSVPVIVENEAGRDVKALLRAQRKGDPPVAYVPDDVMKELLKELTRAGFEDYAGPAPPDGALREARGEIRIEGEGAPPKSFVRRTGQGAEASEVYTRCVATILAVYNFHQPVRAEAGEGDFGVKPAR